MHFELPLIDRTTFLRMYGSEPKMTGALDCRESEAWRNGGGDTIEVSCLGDDIASFEITQSAGSV